MRPSKTNFILEMSIKKCVDYKINTRNERTNTIFFNLRVGFLHLL